jgi:hypothetical protein
MTAPSRRRRLVYLVASFAPVWAFVAAFTGGVGWVIGPLRISSREPFRPLFIGLVAAAYYVWRYARDDRAADGRWLESRLKPVVPLAIPMSVMLGFGLGIYYGSFAAAGSDSYGYVSQARLWLSGTLRVAQPWVEQLSWPDREWIFAPLGYRPYSADGTIVPTYPAGLPIIMAAFEALLGPNGPFFVVPVFAAITLWLTYVLGKEATGSKTAAAMATLLLLGSPVFLAHMMVPMSDVPTAAGWTLVAVLVLKGNADSGPLFAGLAAGFSLLIRPNLVLLAAIPAFAWRARTESLVRYALGLAPAILTLVTLNMFLYYSPLTFGQGSLFESYSLFSAPGNLRTYASWLVQTQTPLIALALVPIFAEQALSAGSKGTSPRACLSALLGLTFVSYVFYGEFDHWLYLRFLLPAYPAMFVLTAAAIRYLCLKVPIEARAPLALCACAAMISYGVRVGADTGIFNQAAFERRYIRAAEDVNARTPQSAVVLAVQHSGSIRFYANRITLRYDWLPADYLETAVRDLIAHGYHPYMVVDDWEEAEFRTRFGSHSRLGRLDWAPLSRVKGSPEVRLYDLGSVINR